MFSFLKKSRGKAEPTEQKKNRLSVFLKDGSTLNFFETDWKAEDMEAPWKDFIDWFMHGSEPYFVMRVKNASFCIPREDANRFTIWIDQK